MSVTYEFVFVQDPEVILASLRAPPPAVKVRGQTRSKLLRLLHCILLVLGGLGFGYGVSSLLTGTADLLLWSTAVGLALVYLAIFGCLFITLTSIVRHQWRRGPISVRSE